MLTWTRPGRDAWKAVVGAAAGAPRRECVAVGWPRRKVPPGFVALGEPALGAEIGAWMDIAFPPLRRDAVAAGLVRWLPYSGEHLRLAAAELGRALRPGAQAFVVLTGRNAAALEPGWSETLGRSGLRRLAAGPLRGPFSALGASRSMRAAFAPWRLADRWLAPRVEPRFAADHFAWVERPAFTARKVHVGSGGVRLEGWLHLDVEPQAGVEHVIDASLGLGVAAGSAEAIFAEHFLEHLEVDRALAFLLEAHRALEPDGWLRLSTPNLAWVITAQAPLDAAAASAWVAACSWNRAFRGWEHRFLWSRPLLEEALLACGFDGLRWPAYGESERPELRGLERHERYPDRPDLAHVLIVEARRGALQPERLARLRRVLYEEYLDHRRD